MTITIILALVFAYAILAALFVGSVCGALDDKADFTYWRIWVATILWPAFAVAILVHFVFWTFYTLGFAVSYRITKVVESARTKKEKKS